MSGFEVGQVVRVTAGEEARRACVSLLDDGLVDVFFEKDFFHDDADQDERCGLRDGVEALLPFETRLLSLKERKTRKVENSEETDNQFLHRAWNVLLKEAAVAACGSCPSFGSVARALALGGRIKAEGNELFKLKDYSAAHEYYSIGLRGLQKTPANFALLPKGGRELRLEKIEAGDSVTGISVHDKTLQGALYLNRARCLSALGQHAEAGQDLTVVIGLYDNDVDVFVPGGSSLAASGLQVSEKERCERLSKAYFLRAKTKVERKKWDAAVADVELGKATCSNLPDLQRLERQIEIARRAYVQGNKKIAKEIAKWADAALEKMETAP